MNKVDELAKIIETGLAEGGALYDIDFVALDNARTALAELVSLAQPEGRQLNGRKPHWCKFPNCLCRPGPVVCEGSPNPTL